MKGREIYFGGENVIYPYGWLLSAVPDPGFLITYNSFKQRRAKSTIPTMGLRLCESLEPPPRALSPHSAEVENDIELLSTTTEAPISEGSDDEEPCDCIPVADGGCNCQFDCYCHYCDQCSFGEFESCEDCCGDRDCHLHDENSIRIARAYLLHSYAEYPLPPELELAVLENDLEFINYGYMYFIQHAETFELKRRLTCDAWSYYRRAGGPLAERLQTLRDWIRDLPDDNSPAMIAGMVAFWKDAVVLDMKTFLVDWRVASLEHPLPWLRDLIAPVREEIEDALRGIEARTAQGP